jgi:hypothetical protein
MPTMKTIRAEELGPEHLGHDIVVPVGLEREGLYLTKITFRADRDNTGSGFRVVVVDANPTRAFDLASYAKVEIYGWEEELGEDDDDAAGNHAPVNWFLRGAHPWCSCGYAPNDNALLNAHWADQGIAWREDNGLLRSSRVVASA